MEVVAKACQGVAEACAGHRLGQAVLRQLDRALWVLEKCAKWAVPPPLDQEERPELVRPLPWVLFLCLLAMLRLTRETISLANLVRGKPPLRSADVVLYIRSKRRYLRTLKYAGSRAHRARSTPAGRPWYGVRPLLAFSMCFRRPASYGNNNTTLANNDEVMVVHGKRPGEMPHEPSTMERLIERIMVDLDAQSDDDSSFTLTNARSDQSVDSQSDQENCNGDGGSLNSTIASIGSSENSMSPIHNDVASSTPEKSTEINDTTNTETVNNDTIEVEEKTVQVTPVKPRDKSELSEPNCIVETNDTKNNSLKEFEVVNSPAKIISPKEESMKFIQGERSPQKIQKPKHNLANGRSMSAPNKKKGLHIQRRPSDVTDGKSADNSF